jgi:hypothetical protein
MSSWPFPRRVAIRKRRGFTARAELCTRPNRRLLRHTKLRQGSCKRALRRKQNRATHVCAKSFWPTG